MGRRETGRGRGVGREKGREGEREAEGEKNNLRGTDREGNEYECIRVPQKFCLNWACRADTIDSPFCRSRVGPTRMSTSRALETAQCRLRTLHARA